MSSSVDRRPALWIIAGPNGSGKSSAYGMAVVDDPAGSVWIINPDILAQRISVSEDMELGPANVAAVNRIEKWLHASVDAYQTIGVETVLSTGKYRALVEAAKRRGFRVNLIYVYLDSADLNVERVAIRVSKGGHAVDESKIRERREKSLLQFEWFFDQADRVDVYNNSGAKPELVMTKRKDSIHVRDDLIPEIVTAVDNLVPGFAASYDEVSD